MTNETEHMNAGLALSERITKFACEEGIAAGLEVPDLIAAMAFAYMQMIVTVIELEPTREARRARAFDLMTLFVEQLRREVDAIDDDDEPDPELATEETR